MIASQLRAWLQNGQPFPVLQGGIDTTSTFSGVMKEVYTAQGVVDALNVETYLLDKAKKAKDFKFFADIGGRYFRKPVRVALSGASRPAAEGGALPASGSFGYQPAQLTEAYHYGVIGVTGQVMNLSKGDRNAFAEALRLTMDGMFEEFHFVANVLLHGYGAGVLGVVSAVNVGAGTITLADDIHPAEWFYNNMKIDSFTNDGQGTAHDAAMVISNVDIVNRVLTVTGLSATVGTDVLVLSGVSTTASPLGLLAARG